MTLSYKISLVLKVKVNPVTYTKMAPDAYNFQIQGFNVKDNACNQLLERNVAISFSVAKKIEQVTNFESAKTAVTIAHRPQCHPSKETIFGR